jgi:hypothetical protein
MELWDYDGGVILQAVAGMSDPSLDDSLDDILGYFYQLTDLIAAWGDIFLNSGFIASPLIKFRDMAYVVQNPGTGWEMRVCEELTEEVFRRTFVTAKRALRRAVLPVLHKFREQNDPGDTTDGTGRDLGVFGLTEVGFGTIRRFGYGREVSLEDSPIQRRVFHVFVDGARRNAQVTLDEITAVYPGGWNNNARNQIYRELRLKLKSIDLTVKKRTLEDVSELEPSQGVEE